MKRGKRIDEEPEKIPEVYALVRACKISRGEVEVEGESFSEVRPDVKTEEVSSEIAVEYCVIVNVHGQDNEQADEKEGNHESHESVPDKLGGTSFC